MSFEENIKKLSIRIEQLLDKVETEEATKTSFILPMLSALGYDVFDPTVVVPEYTADIGRKKGEKVDYAIMRDDIPLILIEAKPHTHKLDRHTTQLERYFTVTDSKFAILTNGIEYRFFSDIEKPNVMDQSPFLIINMLDMKTRDIKMLEKFSQDSLNIESILDMAGSKKYISGIKEIFKQETVSPSDDMARFFASRLTDKKLRQNVIDDFKEYIQQSFAEVINDMVNEKINSIREKLTEDTSVDDIVQGDEGSDDGIETTEQELEGFFIVKSILAEIVPVNRIVGRDTKSYYGILLDDNNRKWICRLRFNAKSNKYISIRSGESDENKFAIENTEDIYKYKQELIAAVSNLIQSKKEDS